MSEKVSSALPRSIDWTRRRKPQPVPVSKKLRSKIARKRRSQVSPILICDDRFSNRPALEADSSSSSCFPGEIALWMSDGLSNVSKKRRSVRDKRKIEDVGGIEVELRRFGSQEQRPITRSYWRRKQTELEEKKRVFEDLGVELSESSCVESSVGVGNGVPINSREASDNKLKSRLEDEREEGMSVIAASDAISLSEASCIQQANAPFVCEEGDFADKTSKPDAVDSTEFQENEASTSTLLELHSAAIDQALNVPFEKTNRAQALSFSEISQNYLEANETLENFEATVDQDPKELDLEYSLACSEDLSYDESLEYSSTSHELSLSQLDSELFSRSSDLVFSDFSPSMLIESLNGSSQESDGDSPPPVYFPFFLQYQKQLFKFDSSDTELSPVREDFYDEYTLLKAENDEDEETYRKFRSRETKLLLYDYNEKYASTEFADLVLKQRNVMINWIVTQSKSLGLQFETMFLGVNLLNRFLGHGFFKHKRKLQVLGIACLALAKRIEENQPYNSVRQSAFCVRKKLHSKSEIIGMEWLAQEVLNFHCFLPTIYNFLGFYLKAAKASDEVEEKAKSLAELLLLDYQRLCYWPSTVAAGLLTLASLGANQELSCQWILEDSSTILCSLGHVEPANAAKPDKAKGTTIVSIHDRSTLILAADGRMTTGKDIDGDDFEKVKKLGKTMMCAMGGYMDEADRVRKHLETIIKEEVSKNTIKRNLTVRQVAQKAYEHAKDKLPESKFFIVIAGYDWKGGYYEPSVYRVTGGGFRWEEYPLVCISGNSKAQGAAFKFLLDGFDEMTDLSEDDNRRILVGLKLARNAIAVASEHHKGTGGTINVYQEIPQNRR